MICLEVISEIAKDLHTDVHLWKSNLKSPLTSVRSQECPLRLLGGRLGTHLEWYTLKAASDLQTGSEYHLDLFGKTLFQKHHWHQPRIQSVLLDSLEDAVETLRRLDTLRKLETSKLTKSFIYASFANCRFKIPLASCQEPRTSSSTPWMTLWRNLGDDILLLKLGT